MEEEEEEIVLDPLLSMVVPVGHWDVGLEILGMSVYEATGEASSTRLVPKAIGEDVMAQREQAT